MARTQRRPPVGPLGQPCPPGGDKGSHSPAPPRPGPPRADQTQHHPAPRDQRAPAPHTSNQHELRDPPGPPRPSGAAPHRGPHSRTSSACLQGAPPPQAWLPGQRVGEARSLLGPTLSPVSRHQPGALGFWKRPPRDQTPLASSIHTRQGRVPHLPAGAPISAQGEGTPKTPPPRPGREMENEQQRGQEEPAGEHAPDRSRTDPRSRPE